MTALKNTPNRIRTRFIAVSALIISTITFGSSLLVFLYMKSTAFENQVLEQVMKHMDWIISHEFEKKIKELKPRPVSDPNDPNRWFWDYIKETQLKQIEEQTSKY